MSKTSDKPKKTTKSKAKKGTAKAGKSTKKAAKKTKAKKSPSKTKKTTTKMKTPTKKVKPSRKKSPKESSVRTTQMIDELLREIRSDDEQISLGAVDRLGQTKDPRATSHLIECLTDSRYMIRIYAAVQLGERQDNAAVDPLIGALHDESLFVRQTVAGALESIGGSKALKAVRRAESEGLLLDELPEGIRL
ncbi:MAG: HEAT repeat domain-containing protein [Candidatus Sifarchaeia archaeon]